MTTSNLIAAGDMVRFRIPHDDATGWTEYTGKVACVYEDGWCDVTVKQGYEKRTFTAKLDWIRIAKRRETT